MSRSIGFGINVLDDEIIKEESQSNYFDFCPIRCRYRWLRIGYLSLERSIENYENICRSFVW